MLLHAPDLNPSSGFFKKKKKKIKRGQAAHILVIDPLSCPFQPIKVFFKIRVLFSPLIIDSLFFWQSIL
jgi:hypothetical protein